MKSDFFVSGVASSLEKLGNVRGKQFDYGDDVARDLLTGEGRYHELKLVAIHRLKGRALLTARKQNEPDARKCF